MPYSTVPGNITPPTEPMDILGFDSSMVEQEQEDPKEHGNSGNFSSEVLERSLTEEEEKILLWVEEAVAVVEAYVGRMRLGVERYLEPTRSLMQPFTHRAVFRNMPEVGCSKVALFG